VGAECYLSGGRQVAGPGHVEQQRAERPHLGHTKERNTEILVSNAAAWEGGVVRRTWSAVRGASSSISTCPHVSASNSQEHMVR